MKSRTSSCKSTALKKDLSRFWPIWAAYALCLLLIQVIQSNDDLSYWYAANMGECISLMGIVNCIFALVTAQTLFGDLFNPRLCNGLHSLPLKREQWFGIHVVSGFLFSLIPTALMLPFSEWIILQYSDMVNGWQMPLYWFAGANIQYVFFFGLAVFCAMCAGSRMAMAVIYGIINFASLLVYLLVDQVYTPLLYGVVTQSKIFELLCPAFRLINSRSIDAHRVETGRTYVDYHGIEQREYIGQFTVISQGWIYMGIIALVGIALLILARQLYKKRKLECAGDFLAVRWLEPVFQVVFSVLCAAACHGMFLLFFGISTEFFYFVLAIGLVAGWFAGRMFLERSTRVFRLKNIAGLSILAGVLAGSLYLTSLDPLGVETWVPEAETVESAALRLNYRNEYTAVETEEIEDVLRLHELALEQRVTVHPDYDGFYYNPNDQDPEAAYISLEYQLDNGWTVQRNYYVLATGESGSLIRDYCSRLDVVIFHQEVEDGEDLRHFMKDGKVITVNGERLPEETVTPEFLMALGAAIAADCEAGHMVQSGVFHTQPVIELENGIDDIYYVNLDIHGGEFWCSLYVYADCENILRVLEPTGILEAIRAEHESYYG